MAQEARARETQQQGVDAYRAGEYEEALEAFDQVRDLSAEAGDRKGEIEALGSMGVVCVELERWDDARRFLDEALSICEETEDLLNKGKVLGNLGMMYARRDDNEKAAEAYEQAIAIFRDLGESGYEKDISRQLSKLGLKESRLFGAVGGFREGLAYKWEASGVPMMAHKLFRLFGRQSGPVSEFEDEEESDTIDLTPEADEE